MDKWLVSVSAMQPGALPALATIAAALAAGVFATSNILVTRWFDRGDRKRLLQSELAYLVIHYRNSINALEATALAVGAPSLKRMKYRGDTLVIGDEGVLARLPIQYAARALHVEGLVRNTNADLDDNIAAIGVGVLSHHQRLALKARFEHVISEVRRVQLVLKPWPLRQLSGLKAKRS